MDTSGKVYQFYINTNDPAAKACLLMDVTPVEFMGMKCIRGKHRTRSASAWTAGKTMYIRIEMISSVIEFDSYDDFVEAAKRFDGEKGK